jgi:predicted adenylyl cyclase CyaB
VIERERKYRLTDRELTRVTAWLDASGTLARREVQDTVHFADVTGRRDSLNLRLRAVDARQELTVKGPRLESGRSKVREEHTVAFSGDMTPVLVALGLHPTERYRKRTTIYALDGALVSLDEVDGVGRFCEIEATDDATIERVAMQLGLTNETLEPRGYARLVRSQSEEGGGEVE